MRADIQDSFADYVRAVAASNLLVTPQESACERMASGATASASNSPGDELLQDLLEEEHAKGPTDADVHPAQAKEAAASLPKPPPSPHSAHPATTSPAKRKRPRKPDIDLDDAIRSAAAAMKAAQKKVQEAKSQARNERRKKQRLLKKAAALNADDLERIAVLKRCGWVRAETAAGPGAASPGGAAPEDRTTGGATSSDAP